MRNSEAWRTGAANDARQSKQVNRWNSIHSLHIRPYKTPPV